MPTESVAGAARPDEEGSPGAGRPADQDVHARLARHGFLVSDDVEDPEGADALASTMLSVIESMLATDQAGEQPAAKSECDDTDGSSPSKA